MDTELLKLKKIIKDFIYQTKWELQDKDFDIENGITQFEANVVESVIDEYNALCE